MSLKSLHPVEADSCPLSWTFAICVCPVNDVHILLYSSIAWQDWLLSKSHRRFPKLGVPCKWTGNILIKVHRSMVREPGEGKELISPARIEVVPVVVQVVPQRHQPHMGLQKIDHLVVLQ